MGEDVRVLNALLDKYERSEFFKAGKSPTRKILLNFYTDTGKNDFPRYNIEEHELRESVNRAVLELERKRLIAYEWNERNHTIKRVWLNMLNLNIAYQEAGRKPKNDVIGDICTLLESAINTIKTPWIVAFLHDEYEAISRKRNFTALISEDDYERTLLLKCMYAIDNLDGAECMARVFSVRAFGDSKIFENSVRPRLLRILKKYSGSYDDITDEDLLRQAGIVRYPEQFEFCGDVCIEFETGMVDFSFLKSGGTVYSSDLLSGKFIISSDVQSIITIENKANYVDYIKSKKKNELVIFHGGQFSPRKKIFFTAVASAMSKNCKWHHWGDIDYGGFSMLLRLRKEILPSVVAYRMSICELKKYEAFINKTKPAYAEKLKTLQSHPELSDCNDCIDYMVNNMLKLEQEAMLVI